MQIGMKHFLFGNEFAITYIRTVKIRTYINHYLPNNNVKNTPRKALYNARIVGFFMSRIINPKIMQEILSWLR